MSDTKKPDDNNTPAYILGADAARMIEGGFAILRDSIARMADDVAAFQQRKPEVRDSIERGNRRTDGRIV